MQQYKAISDASAKGARQLGIQMLTDPVIRPHLEEAQQFGDYGRFRIAHRAYWEQCERFEAYYQEKVFTFAERDSSRLGLDRYNSIDGWNIWYNQIVHPLKDILWEMWEKGVGLEQLYYDACWKARTRRITPAASARPAATPMPAPMAVPPVPYPPQIQARQAS